MSISSCRGERLSTVDAINMGLDPDREWEGSRIGSSASGDIPFGFHLFRAKHIKEKILSLDAPPGMNTHESWVRFVLSEFGGLTHEEISRDRGVSQQVISDSIKSFRSHLRRSLTEDFLDDLREPSNEDLDSVESEIEEGCHS